MSVVDYSIVSDYASLVANYPNARPKAWSTVAIKASQRVNVFAQMEGSEGSGLPVVRKDDFKKGLGDKIVFTTLARLGQNARLGSQTLLGNEEKAKIGTFELQIDIRRHAIGESQKHKLLTAVQLEGAIADLMGQHAGWTQENDMMMTLRLKASKVLYGNNKGSLEQLKSADVISPSIVQSAGQLARTNLALPIKENKARGGWKIPSYLFLSPHDALGSLKQSSQYLTAVEYGQERGNDNPIFSGDVSYWDGHIIYPHYTEDDDSNGPIGSPFAPKAYLGVAITLGTLALTIFGGGNDTAAALTLPLFFGYFNNYDWQFVEGQTPNPDSTNRYLVIYNLTDSGAGDVGKWGFYRYQTNNGNTITTAAYTANDPFALAGAGGPSGGRLQSTANNGASDTGHTVVGNVTWNASVNTTAHPEGSLILQTNSYGVPFAYSVLLGREAVMRGYGMNPMKRINNNQDYDFLAGQGYQITYGQTPFYDTNGVVRRYILLVHTISYPGINLPVVS